jgi:HK97 family phage portal protein
MDPAALDRLFGSPPWVPAKAQAKQNPPFSLTGGQWTGTAYVDAYKRTRQPTPNELMAELKNTAWACASINAAVCASNPPALYVATIADQNAAKCPTRPIPKALDHRLRKIAHLPARIKQASRIERVVDHPLLVLLDQVNPVHNAFDLWELTTLYQEVHGIAYWYLQLGPLGVPEQIWLLPTQNVTPQRDPNSPAVVDRYVYQTGARRQVFQPREVIAFRYPDPRDPYLSGLSPLRACYEQVALKSEYSAMRSAIYENQAIPSAIVSPDEAISEEERDRIEAQWNQKFRRGGSGRVLVADYKMKVDLLQQSMGDLAQLAEMRATHEDICNAFHCPIAYFTTNTNLANLQAAERQHMTLAIRPRLQRRDEKINEQLIPLYDPSRRLFVASEDPTPVEPEVYWQQQKVDMQFGIRTINEMRAEEGLEPVPWGNEPWLPANWWPVSQQRGVDQQSRATEVTENTERDTQDGGK